MKSKLKTIVLAFCAIFFLSANFYSQESESNSQEKQETQKEQSSQNTQNSQEAQNNEQANNDDKTDEGDSPDVYDDQYDFVYLQNAPGDQFINVRLMPNFPLNFGKNLKVGGQATVGYGRFLTSWLALDVELGFGYNPTIGSNILTYIPMTVGVTFLPAIKKFEFPITFNIGMVATNYLANTFFPGLIIRAGAGCYYRISEGWSAGIEGFFTYMPQWYFKDSSKNDYLNMASVSAGVKYHF